MKIIKYFVLNKIYHENLAHAFLFTFLMWLLDNLKLHMWFAFVACTEFPFDSDILKQKLANDE